MNASRALFTATPLLDGQVLIVGGEDRWPSSIETLASAELFDPCTGKFTPTGSMAQAREMHQAVRLIDGSVLVVGGYAGTYPNTVIPTAPELYDPATGLFAKLPAFEPSLVAETATLLLDGRVLITSVAGGFGGLSATAGAGWLYDPQRRTLTRAWSMGSNWGASAAVRLADGRVLLAGEYSVSPSADSPSGYLGTPIGTSHIYDPQTGTLSLTGSMAPSSWEGRQGFVLLLLPDGQVLSTGGVSEDGSPPLQLFNPVTGKWSLGALLPGYLYGYAVAPLPDGRVLIAGGNGGRSAFIFDPKTMSLTPATPTVADCYLATAVWLGDGRVLIVGGLSPGGQVSVHDAQIYQP